jgi:hypothetical protein
MYYSSPEKWTRYPASVNGHKHRARGETQTYDLNKMTSRSNKEACKLLGSLTLSFYLKFEIVAESSIVQ